MFVSLWLNTVTSCSNVFYRAYFCFFMTLFLRKMGMILSARKPHYHSELSKPILKIQSICRKKYFRVNNFLKQYALDTFSDFFCTKISNIFYKIKFDGQSCQTVHRRSMNKMLWWILYEKTYARVSFFNKVSRPQAKEKLPQKYFSCEFYQIFQNAVYAKYIRVTASAKYSWLPISGTSRGPKNVVPLSGNSTYPKLGQKSVINGNKG